MHNSPRGRDYYHPYCKDEGGAFETLNDLCRVTQLENSGMGFKARLSNSWRGPTLGLCHCRRLHVWSLGPGPPTEVPVPLGLGLCLELSL